MTTVNIYDIPKGFSKDNLAFSCEGKKGKSKNGEDYCVKKIVPIEEESKARPKSLVLKFRNVESWGMKKFTTIEGSNHLSFSLILEEQAKQKIESVIQACKNLAKTRKNLKKLSFERFSPLRGNVLYCCVKYNPKAKRFYTKFMKGLEQINPLILIEKECLVDAAVRLDSIFCKKEECFFHLNLIEVRHKKSISISSFLDEPIESEGSDDEESLGEKIQQEYKKALKKSTE